MWACSLIICLLISVVFAQTNWNHHWVNSFIFMLTEKFSSWVSIVLVLTVLTGMCNRLERPSGSSCTVSTLPVPKCLDDRVFNVVCCNCSRSPDTKTVAAILLVLHTSLVEAISKCRESLSSQWPAILELEKWPRTEAPPLQVRTNCCHWAKVLELLMVTHSNEGDTWRSTELSFADKWTLRSNFESIGMDNSLILRK